MVDAVALSTVTLKWNLTDLVQGGQTATLIITPSAQMADSTDHVLVAQPVPRRVVFSGGQGQLAGIIANDNSSILPTGTGYTIEVVTSAGAVVVPAFTTQLLTANGATQWLDQLAPVSAVTTGYLFLPLPSGTPQAGQVPGVIANGSPATAWTSAGGSGAVSSVFGRTGAVVATTGDYTAAQVGADASGAASTAQANAIAAIPAIDPTATDILPLGTQAAGSTGKTADAGHVHPLTGGFSPSDVGLLEWNYDPLIASTGTPLATSGQITLIRVPVRVARSITSVNIVTTALGASLVSAENFAGVYTSGGTLVGASADQTATWNTGGSTGFMTIPLAGGPFAVAAGWVWVALLFNGVTGPSLVRTANLAGGAANLGGGPSTVRFGHAPGTTTTSLPSSITPGSNTGTQITFWAGLS